MTKILFAFYLMLMISLGYAPAIQAADESERASVQEVRQESHELIEALKGYGADQRDKAIQETAAAMKKLDARIDALQDRIDRNWTKMSDAAQKEARANLKALIKQRIELAERYGSLKSSSAEAWEHMKAGFSNAYQALHDAWENATREYERREK